MKICILSFYYPPDLCAGSFRAESLVMALLKNHKNITQIEILTTTPNRYNSHKVKYANNSNNEKVLIKRIRVPKHKSGFFGQSIAFLFFAFGVFINSKGKQWDLLVCTSSRLMTAFLGAIISKKNNIKLYLDIRDLFVDTMSDVLSKSYFKYFLYIFKFIEKWTFNSADKINLVSYGFKKYLNTRVNNIPLSYFTNGIDDLFKNPLAPLENKKFPNMINILYAGNVGSGQALHKIIPRFALDYQNLVSFTVVGDGGKRQELENQIKNKNIFNVCILNPVDRNSLIKYYRKADILFLHLNNMTAFKKVLPSKIFEYASLGKPILAGVDGYASDFVKKEIEGGVVFRPCDQLSLNRAFEKTIKDKQYFDRTNFIKKYQRQNIMKLMALDIFEMIK